MSWINTVGTSLPPARMWYYLVECFGPYLFLGQNASHWKEKYLSTFLLLYRNFETRENKLIEERTRWASEISALLNNLSIDRKTANFLQRILAKSKFPDKVKVAPKKFSTDVAHLVVDDRKPALKNLDSPIFSNMQRKLFAKAKNRVAFATSHNDSSDKYETIDSENSPLNFTNELQQETFRFFEFAPVGNGNKSYDEIIDYDKTMLEIFEKMSTKLCELASHSANRSLKKECFTLWTVYIKAVDRVLF